MMTTRSDRADAIVRSRAALDGRPGYRVRGTWGRVSVLEGGGHLCELSLNECPGVNPLWKPPWNTIDPDKYVRSKDSRSYGPPPDGKLLAGIAGHSLSFDHFGPPSREETAAGLSTHGETPVLRWEARRIIQSPTPTLQYGVKLPEAQIDFNRTISISGDYPMIFCEEEATHFSRYDRPISWNQHVTFGPPFLECGTTLFDMPATRSKVCPASYSSKIYLTPDAEFIWPNAPKTDGSCADLRTTPDLIFGHYTAQLLDPQLEIAFVAACNPRMRLLVVYLFRRADFPWVGNWEEHHSRTQAPWKGRTFCRGVEFSTTPFAIPRREAVDLGRLFGEATYRWLPARSRLTVRFAILLFSVPGGFLGVRGVSVEGGKARVALSGPGLHELTAPIGNFL